MKISLFLIILFIIVIVFASVAVEDDPNLIGGTELNGNGCVCHTTERDYNVNVWVEGPDTLYTGQMGLYRMYLAGGPAEAGGYNVAGRFGTMELVDTFSFRHELAKNELTQAFSLPFPSAADTIFWEFGYTASDSSAIDTIYSCGISLVWDSIPDALDRWNFGSKFPLTILSVTTIHSETNEHPSEFKIEQNYPNPFNPSTKISWQTTEGSWQTLKVYDVPGNEVVTLVNEYKPAGSYEVEFDASSFPSGVYFYKFQSGNFTKTSKMLLLR
jgi:hypothetical protein